MDMYIVRLYTIEPTITYKDIALFRSRSLAESCAETEEQIMAEEGTLEGHFFAIDTLIVQDID